jgi:hypothetical protein
MNVKLFKETAMKKRALGFKKLQLVTETLRRLEPSQVRRAVGGQDYQCTGPDSSDGFSGMPISYCDTISGQSGCP